MAGDIIGLTEKSRKDTIDTLGGTESGKPVGQTSSIFFNDSIKGVPRRDNLFAVRLLGQATQIEWLKDIIKHQVASTDFQVKPVIDNQDTEPSDRQVQAANEIENFLHGNFNTDDQSFDDLLKLILDDILDFDAGVLELVRDEAGYLEQIITRDGLTFTKNINESGQLPEPDSDEPAYYQFSPAASGTQNLTTDRRGIDVRDIQDELSGLPFSRMRGKETLEFSRDQIVWFQENPISYSPYGRGRTQKVKNAAEIVLNGDNHRNRFFLDNEFHKGVMTVDSSVSQKDKKQLKRRFKESKGNEHELPVVGTSEGIDYVSIDPEPEKMQFLESQKWYTKLVTMAYGLNDTEAGLMENANKGISENARKNVWNRTTQPLLEMIERKFNNQVLPFMRPYEAVDGMVEFEFDPQNMFLEKLQNDLVTDKLENNTTTLNEARQELGKEPYGEIGNVPLSVFKEYSRENPSEVIEMITELEDVPSGDGGGGGLFQSYLNGDNDGDDEKESGTDSTKEVRQADKEERNEGESGSPQEINDYRDAFKHSDKILEQTKDALRNERGFNDVPGIVEHKEQMREDIAQVFSKVVDQVKDSVEQEFPEEEQDGSNLVDADKIVDNVNIQQQLANNLQKFNLEALEKSAEHHEQEIEKETEEKLTVPSETKIEISFDIMDTFTADFIRNEALSNATTIEDTVKDRLKNDILKGAEAGEGIPQITNRLQETQENLSDEKAELVARTETLSSSRKGSQALAESTDLVQGKEWISTQDARVREWHDVMDGQIVDKDDVFTVPKTGSDDQPNNYPRTARVVGEDQPYNCRCSQAPVLAEDMPDDVNQLEADFDGVKVDLGLPKEQKTGKCRQLEMWRKHSKKDEASFKEFWNRINDEMSKSEIADKFDMSKSTVYSWSK